MKLTWLKNGFICKELYAPFKISKDIDYRNDLEKKYNIVIEQAKKANADDESMRIINVFSTKILESLDLYYKADYTYSYDALGRLTQVNHNENMLRSYQYDSFGNRTEVYDEVHGRMKYHYNSADRMTKMIDVDVQKVDVIYMIKLVKKDGVALM